jgi:hypothetical protein
MEDSIMPAIVEFPNVGNEEREELGHAGDNDKEPMQFVE